MSVGLLVDQIVFDQLLVNRLTDCSDFFVQLGKVPVPVKLGKMSRENLKIGKNRIVKTSIWEIDFFSPKNFKIDNLSVFKLSILYLPRFKSLVFFQGLFSVAMCHVALPDRHSALFKGKNRHAPLLITSVLPYALTIYLVLMKYTFKSQ